MVHQSSLPTTPTQPAGLDDHTLQEQCFVSADFGRETFGWMSEIATHFRIGRTAAAAGLEQVDTNIAEAKFPLAPQLDVDQLLAEYGFKRLDGDLFFSESGLCQTVSVEDLTKKPAMDFFLSFADQLLDFSSAVSPLRLPELLNGNDVSEIGPTVADIHRELHQAQLLTRYVPFLMLTAAAHELSMSCSEGVAEEVSISPIAANLIGIAADELGLEEMPDLLNPPQSSATLALSDSVQIKIEALTSEEIKSGGLFKAVIDGCEILVTKQMIDSSGFDSESPVNRMLQLPESHHTHLTNLIDELFGDSPLRFGSSLPQSVITYSDRLFQLFTWEPGGSSKGINEDPGLVIGSMIEYRFPRVARETDQMLSNHPELGSRYVASERAQKFYKLHKNDDDPDVGHAYSIVLLASLKYPAPAAFEGVQQQENSIGRRLRVITKMIEFAQARLQYDENLLIDRAGLDWRGRYTWSER